MASTVRVCLNTQDDRGVNNFFLRQKKSRSDFFWRHPLRVTARLDVSTVALTSQPSPLPTRQKKKLRQKKIAERFFFGVDRCASQLSPLPTGPRTSQLAWTNRPFRKFVSYFFRKPCHLMTYKFLLIRRVHKMVASQS